MKTKTSKQQVKVQEKSFWTPLRLALAIVVLSLIATIGISSCQSSDEKSTLGKSEPAPPVKNAPAPPVRNAPPPPSPPAVASLPPEIREAHLRTINGGTVKLSDYGGKILLVNLWATWCGPCRLEIPELVKLHKEFQSQGVETVGLSTEDPESSAESVRSFVQHFNVDYRIGWATPEVAITLMQGRDAIPQLFIISRDGRILKRFVGFNPDYTPPQVRQAIEDALSGKG